ncbi:MAG: extracellular solute-binding protein [Acidimicrobiales bacterium]
MLDPSGAGPAHLRGLRGRDGTARLPSSSPRRRRGALSAVAGLTSAGLLLGACGSASTSSGSTGGSAGNGAKAKVVHLTYWSGHASGALHTAVVAEVAKFNQSHPKIQVTFKPIGATKHGLAAFNAGQAPSVGMVSSYIVPQLANAGAILDLGPYISGKGGLTKAQISPHVPCGDALPA